MKRLFFLVVLACFFTLTTAGDVFSLMHPYQWEDPRFDDECHPWGGEDNSSGGPVLSVVRDDYRAYTDNFTLDVLINVILTGWSQPYRPHRPIRETMDDQTQQPTTVNSTNRGN